MPPSTFAYETIISQRQKVEHQRWSTTESQEHHCTPLGQPAGGSPLDHCIQNCSGKEPEYSLQIPPGRNLKIGGWKDGPTGVERAHPAPAENPVMAPSTSHGSFSSLPSAGSRPAHGAHTYMQATAQTHTTGRNIFFKKEVYK